MCKREVKDIQNKIKKLLEMTNASIQLMKNMTGTLSHILQYTLKVSIQVV